MADGFLGRWSRRKIDVQQGKPVEAEPPIPEAPPAHHPVAAPPERDPVLDEKASAIEDRPPAPTLDDVAALTPEADFSRFVQSDVAPEVRNAAVKKLFADPHFNVMDGLDVYIDDYGKPDPMPEAMLRGLASAEFLGLFREEKVPEESTSQHREAADAQPTASVSQSTAPEATPSQGDAAPAVSTDPERPSHDAHPDLRLQQDDAPGPEGPGPGPR